MNSKQLKRQLFIAIISVLVSAIGLSVSTYAWFVNNNSVTASGMNITAQTDGISFEIATSSVNEEGNLKPVIINGQTSAGYENLSATMFPTHTDNVSSVKLSSPPIWVHAFSNDYNDAASGATTDNLDTSIDYNNHLLKADSKNYALVATYYIHINRQATPDDTTINNIGVIQATISGTDNSELKKSVSVLVVGEDGSASIPYGATSSSSVICNSVVAGDDKWHQIDVYVYFDGKNENCKSSYYDNNNVSVSLTFGTVTPEE